MPKRRTPTWLHAPVYVAIRAALATMLTGEISANLRRARAFARLYARFEPGRVRRAMHNIEVAFPAMPEPERHAQALLAYEHLFMLAVEMAHTPRLVGHDSWPEHIRLSGVDRAVRLLSSGRPCVLITGHCGNWELLGYALAVVGFPIHALYRPLDLAPLDRWLRRTRERRGLVLLDKFGAAEAMPRLMDAGASVGFIADQNAGDRGLFVPFFNRLASTYKSIGLIALQYDAPIICGQARRLVPWRDSGGLISGGGGAHEMLSGPGSVGFDDYSAEPFRYHVDITDIIMPEDWTGRPDPLFYVSARYRRALEGMVRRAPEQNLWLHRYWKSRPRHEHQGRPIPPALRDKIRSLPWITDDDMASIEDWSARDAAAIARRPPKPSLSGVRG